MISGEGGRREAIEGLGDGSIEVVVGHVEVVEGVDADAGEAAGEVVVLEEEAGEVREAVEREGNLASEVVAGEVEAAEAAQPGHGRQDPAGELVVLEVEASEEGEIAEIVGDGAGEAVGAEGEDAEGGEAAESASGDGANQADAREAELHNRGVAGVAGDADPAAGGGVSIPLDALLVGDTGEEGQKRRLFLRRLPTSHSSHGDEECQREENWKPHWESENN